MEVKKMETLLSKVGSLLYGMRFTMLFFYVGLVTIIFGILGKFVLSAIGISFAERLTREKAQA
jgi:hypothetical protein